jgi:acyl-CoA synthetase (AMP-forming)/AMP-acid ligase II/acyl carrier protein
MFIGRGPALISSGDTLSEDILARLSAYSVKHERICINAYGPTETTINSSFAVISDNTTIGHPVPNAQFYIVNEHGQILPKGSKGELWIGGAGVTRGYLNRDDLTSQSFIDNPFEPFASASQHKLYKTGDLVSYRPDGSLAFWGRIDQQVKIRGFRIELGEIESVICTVQGVCNAVVTQREAAGEKQLVACIVVNTEITNAIDIIETVREEVSSRLPDYMVPSLVVVIDSIPLSATGKVDRKLLLEKVSESTQVGSQNLSTATQEQLAIIWKELLDLPDVGVNSNFFELGGHSLLAIRLSSEIGKVFNLDVGLLEIFEYNTLQNMAEYIDGLSKDCFIENETITALDYFEEKGEAALEI